MTLYGISSGNGNDGVSHMFASYYVNTDQPWRLAKLAAVSQMKEGAGQAWALRNIEIDGEAEYCISAIFYDPPCEDTADGEYPELPWSESEDAEDGRNWSDGNGAWMIVEIFPEDEPRDGRPVYENLIAAFSADVLALVPAES
jgi:hypothetical protein